MGSTLNNVALSAFVDELSSLEKQASVLRVGRGILRGAASTGYEAGRSVPGWVSGAAKSFGKGMQEAGHRLLHPVRGMQQGWKSMSPRQAMKTMTPAEAKKSMEPGWIFSSGKHLTRNTDKAVPLGKALGKGKIKGLAEELSRRGWTGRGDATKYMPIGGKSQLGLWTAPYVHSASKAPKATPTGEGGAGEEAGAGLGGMAGMAMSGGLGMAGIIPWLAAEYGGRKAGQIVDRMRSGASLRDAVKAPSPREAREQLSEIQRHYG